MNCTIDVSSSSPPVRIDVSLPMPDSAMTAISVVPPPMSMTMLPVGVSTGSPTPMAAAIGSATMKTCLAPAVSAESRTARRSTSVMPDGTQTITLGFTRKKCLSMMSFRKYRSIFSVTSKSAITPSLSGRTAMIPSGVRPSIRLASRPMPRMRPLPFSMATTEGSLSTIPSPLTYTRVLSVPRSTAISLAGSSEENLSAPSFIEETPRQRPGRTGADLSYKHQYGRTRRRLPLAQPGAAESAVAPLRTGQFVTFGQGNLSHRSHHHLGNPHPPLHPERLRTKVDQCHLQFATIIRVDRGRAVGQGDAVPVGEAGARPDLGLVPLRQRDGEAGREEPPLERGKDRIFGAGQVHAGGPRRRIRRQGQPCPMGQAADSDRDRDDLHAYRTVLTSVSDIPNASATPG